MAKSHIRLAASILQKALPFKPSIAMVLGSGFRDAAQHAHIDKEIPFSKVPGFPQPAVGGHAGKVILARFGRVPALLLSGRSHYYEGHRMTDITFPIRVLAALGIRRVLLTNAAGGINARFKPGDFMVIRDHINLLPENPLRGRLSPGISRFLDLTHAYDPTLRDTLRKAGRAAGVRLHSGVYLAVSGPSYETPAEIRAFRAMGADAVGMSTVPETIVARHCGMAVAGLSCISNAAAGLGKGAVSHTEVLEVGQRSSETAGKLIARFCQLLDKVL